MAIALMVDDDRAAIRIVQEAVADLAIEVLPAHTVAEGELLFDRRTPDVLLVDIMFPTGNGLELARRIRAADATLPVIFLTASEDSNVAIEAMKLGAYDYLLKPLDAARLGEVIHRAVETRRMMQSPLQRPAEAEKETPFCAEQQGGRCGKGCVSPCPAAADVLIGRSPQMLAVYKQIGRVAAQDVAVLICGESGTGKELVAKAIYQHSNRAGGPFLAVNCAALPDMLLESELFGHEKGAFTGADRRHIGKFEQCDGGTLFLDEIGDMSASTQSKMLRLLQEQRFERVGGAETIETDVRLISATNCDLGQRIQEGRFRLDLFHRVNAFEIALPPLCQRGDDLDLLVDYWLRRFNRQFGKPVVGVAPAAMELLENYAWPGNVRELQSVLQKAVLLATGPVIVPEFLPPEFFARRPPEPSPPLDGATTDFARFLAEHQAGADDLYAQSVQWLERHLLSCVLREADGNQSRAAQRLGITRGSLRHKLRSLGITLELVVGRS
jgi:two-component system nitrogen regulation response regulator GlnG